MVSPISFDGVVSGLQTQDIIQQLMSLERRPLLVLQKKIDAEKARLQAVNAIKSQISALQGVMAQLAKLGSLNGKSATTDTPGTMAAILTASATAEAINGTYQVTVHQLATATRLQSGAPLGQVIDKNAVLASAGFRLTPVVTDDGNPATLSLNGQTITVDDTTTLDDGTANSLVAKINASGAGVTASLVADVDGRAENRFQLVSAPGQGIQLGSLADTSNVLRLLGLADASVQGYTASELTSATASAGALSTSITINGVNTSIEQSNGGFTAAQNADFIADAINANADNKVLAVDNGDGTFKLIQKTLGSQQAIDISAAGTGTGLSVGLTKTGTDRVLSTTNLGVANVGVPLAESRLVTPISGLDAGGNGKFSVNGVEISYKASDTLSGIINRINASAAGVTAFYDPIQDQIRLTASKTGGQSVAVADVTGNFLAATGLLSATQTLGQNASFSIDTVNGGAPLSSSTNSISGYIPGVALELKSASATTVTVTVSQDTASAAALMRSFVEKANAVLDTIAAQTSSDPKAGTSRPLSGDSSMIMLERTLRTLIGGNPLGMSGKYQNFASIGVSTGAIGSTVGTATRYQLDEARLTAALQDNPQAVSQLVAAFEASVGTPSGTGNVTAVSGSPLKPHESGTYYVKVLDASNNVEVRFVTDDGRQLLKTTGTLAPGVENSSLIPGVKLTANATLAVGEDSFAVTVASRGLAIRLNDHLDSLLDPGGFFQNRETTTQTVTEDLEERIRLMEERLKDRETTLVRKFSALERTLALLQSQSGALQSSIAQLASLNQQPQ